MKYIYNQIEARVFIFSASVLAFFMPSVSFAQIQNPLPGITNIPNLVHTILGYVVQVGGVIAICAFIYSGFKFVQARGNEKGLEEAKNIFFYTCIGVAILLGAQVIASIVVGTITNVQS